jgi:tetratricopeptide (TPR) repeat protein
MRLRGLSALIVVILLASSAMAQTRDEQLRACGGLGGEAPEARVKACSAVIASGQESNERLAAVFFDRGNAHVALGQPREAIADYDQVLRLKPTSPIAFTNRGSVFHRLGQYDRAIRDFDQALTLSPNDALALNDRCLDLAIVGKLGEAAADCERALALAPNASEVLGSRALINLKAGRAQAALSDYDHALAGGKRVAGWLFGRGIAKTKLGDKAGGDADIAAAKRLEPDIVKQYARYGVRL